MIERYLAELRAELAAVGVRGRLRRRVLAEAEDHLRSDPEATRRFGSAAEVANELAAVLGAQASRRAAALSFAALAVAGAAYAFAYVSLALVGPPPDSTSSAAADLAMLALVLAPQVAFVAGSLAALRAWHRRRERRLPTAELALLNRRTGTALACGLATMGALAAYAASTRSALPAWWSDAGLALSVAGCFALAGASWRFAAAARLRPRVAGAAEDLFDDLPLAPYRDDPWRFARHVAITIGALVWLAGVAAGDPIDGAVRGAAEALACLGGFAVLGRPLGLRG